MSVFRRWRRDERGNVAMIFALVSVVFFGAAGAAIDYSRASAAQADLQRAADSAAMLAAKSYGAGSVSSMSNDKALAYIKGTFDLSGIENLSASIQFLTDKAVVTVSGTVRTTLAGLLGLNEVPVRTVSEVMYGGKLEVVLVLDNTGSMAGAKISNLTLAARRFIEDMQNAIPSGNLKIGLVPFDTGVRAPVSSAWWIKRDRRRPGTDCLWDRVSPYDVDDTTPSETLPDTMFTPDENRSSCELAPMIPLTKDFAALQSGVARMSAVGNTNLTIGLAWGLHMLTATEPMTEAVPAGTKGTDKFLIFMTDGENTANRTTTNATAIDARTRLVCQAIKDKGIRVFTARIIEGNQKLLTECASIPDWYYPIQTPEQIDGVLKEIQKTITGLRFAR
jgi:Flp pilus assembly protein TadG